MKTLLLAVGAALALSSAALAADPVVATTHGPIVGDVAAGVASFKGVPFAKPPVGALRWRAPQAPESWSAPRPAKTYGADCMQSPFPAMQRLWA